MITAQLCGQVVSMVAHHGGSRNLASVRRQTHHVHRMLPGVDIPGSLRHLHPLHTTHRRADPPSSSPPRTLLDVLCVIMLDCATHLISSLDTASTTRIHADICYRNDPTP